MRLPEIGATYYSIGTPNGMRADIPRVVDRIEQGVGDDVIVHVRAPGGSLSWPVRKFWKLYREPTSKERA